MKRLNTFAGLKKGTKFKVLDNVGGNNYPRNKVLTMVRHGLNTQENDIAKEVKGNSLMASSCALVSQSKDDLINELNDLTKEYEKEASEIKDKLEFLTANGEEHFDDDVFKVFRVLKSLQKGKDDMTKAKLIAKIIES